MKGINKQQQSNTEFKVSSTFSKVVRVKGRRAPWKRQPRYVSALQPFSVKASPYGDHISRIWKRRLCRLFIYRILGCAIRRTTVLKHQSSGLHISAVAFRGRRPTSPRAFGKARPKLLILWWRIRFSIEKASRNTALPPAEKLDQNF